MICASSEDSDQPGHPPSLIRVFAVRMKKAWVLSYPLSALRRLWSDWADLQADLSLRWAHRPFCWFCHDAIHFRLPLVDPARQRFFSKCLGLGDTEEGNSRKSCQNVCSSNISFGQYLYKICSKVILHRLWKTFIRYKTGPYAVLTLGPRLCCIQFSLRFLLVKERFGLLVVFLYSLCYA